MSKNREYTGLERTPSSMAWLIDKRRSLKGQVEWVRRQIARRQRELEQLPLQLVQLETELANLDAVFKLHAVQVEPRVITGKRPKRKALLPYGVLSKLILKTLRTAEGPLSTSAVARRIAEALDEPIGWEKTTLLRQRTRRRLKGLVAEGFVERHHPLRAGAQDEGVWSLRQDCPWDGTAAENSSPRLLRAA
jgi:hypothetical protein